MRIEIIKNTVILKLMKIKKTQRIKLNFKKLKFKYLKLTFRIIIETQ